MSMELLVAFSGTMPTGSQFDHTLTTLGLPYRLADPPPALDGWTGYLPFSYDGRSTGVELDMFDGLEAVRDAFGSATPESAERLAALRWSGDVHEAAAAFSAAAALATIVNGTILDPSEGATLSIEDTVAMAHELLDTG